MTTSVSRRLNILCIMFTIIAPFIIMLFAWLYVMIDNLLTCGKYLHDRITSLREDIQTHKTSFIEVPVPSQESERLCICVLGVSILFLRF